MRRFLATASLCAALSPLFSTGASAVEGKPEMDRWRHRFCSFDRCSPGRQHPWSVAIGFGVAAVAAGWLGRRTQPQTD
jgi:hypothetical protein